MSLVPNLAKDPSQDHGQHKVWDDIDEKYASYPQEHIECKPDDLSMYEEMKQIASTVCYLSDDMIFERLKEKMAEQPDYSKHLINNIQNIRDPTDIRFLLRSLEQLGIVPRKLRIYNMEYAFSNINSGVCLIFHGGSYKNCIETCVWVLVSKIQTQDSTDVEKDQLLIKFAEVYNETKRTGLHIGGCSIS